MRRALVLGAAGLALAAMVVLALVLSAQPAAVASAPRITRIFIPAIKTACILDTVGATDAQIGYTFTDDGALTTIDQDGSLTGLPPYTLFRLNECLAKYPIEPSRELPHDHYSRNLFYDYDRTVLKPCLEEALGRELPPLPARSDFVVRLYVWDPYLRLSRELPLDELLTLASACPPVPAYLDEPATTSDAAMHPMESPAQQECFTAAGIITYPAETWSVTGIYLRVYDPDGNVVAALNTQVSGVVTGQTVLDCLDAAT